MNKTLIGDPRLTPEMERIRSGKSQLFRRKGMDREFTTKSNSDIVLIPPQRELYAELIDGKWYWVNGCAECNGNPRSWSSYIECEKHNVCRTCKKPRKDVEKAWGGSEGWQCGVCHDKEAGERKIAALSKMAEKEYDETDYWGTDKIICPHCEYSYEMEDSVPGGDEVCERCGGEFTVEPEYHITFTTAVKGKRLTIKDIR